MLAAPGNILLEIGSHLLAHVVEAGGRARRSRRARRPRDRAARRAALPAALADRRDGRCGPPLSIEACFAPGFPEYRVHARGALGAATADLERGDLHLRAQLLRAHGPRALHDRRRRRGGAARSRPRAASRRRAREGRRARAPPTLSRPRSPARCARSTPASPGPASSTRASCRRAARTSSRSASRSARRPARRPGPLPASAAGPPARELDCETLVLGGNGFIGRALVAKAPRGRRGGARPRAAAAGLPDDPTAARRRAREP